MLKLVNITKEYQLDKDSVLALHDVSIEFRKNEFVSILGPSGCGKTTLLNIIGGLDRYTSGDIQIDGVSTKQYDDVDWDTYRNRRIGFVFQSYNLIPHMNILKNVSLSLTLAGVGKEEARERAMKALEKVGLLSQAKKKPNQMSGGQMQRVAIARALVNNPEIILADEPTGALDSESGIQVMDLLKEVAQDRLVIMVTHNPVLAEEYSTRIVYLKDGEVVGDTMPYDSAQEEAEKQEMAVANEESCDVKDENVDEENIALAENADIQNVDGENGVTENAENTVEENAKVDADVAENAEQNDAPRKMTFKEKMAKLKAKLLKLKKAERSGMKRTTAINLSWNNLLAKKGRTLLTSIAGSIGIIGIILVLSLSTGASMYIDSLEESALSTYPLTISQTNADMASILSMLTTPSSEEANRVQNPNTDEIFTAKLLGKVVDNLNTLLAENDLKKLKAYIDENFDDSLATVKYNYGVNFNAYVQDPGKEDRYMKVNPYQETMAGVLDSMPDSIKNMSVGGMTVTQMIEMFTSGSTSMMTSWTEMSSNQKLLESQYELVGEQSRWPSKATDVVIVVDSKNQLLDYQIFMLGLQSQDDVIKALMDSHWAEYETSVEKLLSLKYKILTDADYLIEDDADGDGVGDGTWTAHNHGEQNKAWIDAQDPVEIDVVGVIRPKPGATVTSISGVLGYTSELSEMLIDRASKHPAIVRMNELKTLDEEETGYGYYKSCINYSYNTENGGMVNVVANSTDIHYGEDVAEHANLMRKLGVAELDDPTSIEFYCASFESKEKIVKFIDDYNAKMKKEDPSFADVRYGDSLAVMMMFVNTMATTITGVLVAFAAISLVVSTIMIAIIIYTSVLERRKEIGVLRSIGARKKDISRVFIAESGILGAYSGAIGVIISFVFGAIGNAILKAVFEIDGLMTIEWWHCILMFLISVLLSVIAGFIPSRIAAKKDPAIALRSE